MISVPVYVDEDSCGRRFVRAMRRLGFDVLTTTEAGRSSESDEEQLRFAAEHARVIVTANRGDFSELWKVWAVAGREHAGVVIWGQGHRSPEAVAAAILQMTADLPPDGMANAILYV